jgi:hypothetical protein
MEYLLLIPFLAMLACIAWDRQGRWDSGGTGCWCDKCRAIPPRTIPLPPSNSSAPETSTDRSTTT